MDAFDRAKFEPIQFYGGMGRKQCQVVNVLAYAGDSQALRMRRPRNRNRAFYCGFNTAFRSMGGARDHRGSWM
jgi:hypothetical protein